MSRILFGVSPQFVTLGAAVRYEILGSLRLVSDNGVHLITAPKIEKLLTVLVIKSDQITSIGKLVNEVWLDEPPKRAVSAVHVYISQLRKFLRFPGSCDSPIVTRNPGYLLRLGDDETDLQGFQGFVDSGWVHVRAGRHVEAVRSFQDALALWRGPVVDDSGAGPILRGFAVWLDELRLECIEAMVASGLAIGRHYELIPFLHSVVAEYPLNETFHHQLMLALYLSGRRGEALKAYQSARTTLRVELGLDPCHALTELQQLILNADEVPDDVRHTVPLPRGWSSPVANSDGPVLVERVTAELRPGLV